MKKLRLIIGLALVAGLWWSGYIDPAALAGVASRPGLLVLAVIVLFLTIPLGGLRWHLLLRAHRLPVTLAQTVAMAMSGAFFNAFLPGGCGGDIVRGAYLVRAARGHTAPAVISLLADRTLSFAGFILVAGVALWLRPVDLPGVTRGGLLSGVSVVVLVLALLLWWSGMVHPGHALARARHLVRAYARHGHLVFAGLVLSVAITLLDALSIMLVAASARIGTLPLTAHGLAGILATIANSLPLTPGGLGVGEAAYAQLCAALEVVPSAAPYATVFLAYRAITVASTLPGIIITPEPDTHGMRRV